MENFTLRHFQLSGQELGQSWDLLKTHVKTFLMSCYFNNSCNNQNSDSNVDVSIFFSYLDSTSGFVGL